MLKWALLHKMSQKFTADDLFRIADEHLSDIEAFEFRFRCAQGVFREATGKVLTPQPLQEPVSLTKDEVGMFEKLFQGLQTSRGRGAR